MTYKPTYPEQIALRLCKSDTKTTSISRDIVKERSLRGGKVMERRERQFEMNDLGLLIFAIVAGWLLVFQSGLF